MSNENIQLKESQDIIQQNTGTHLESLCGSCSKPKGDTEECCVCGRPSKYKEEYIEKVDEYIELNQDEEVQKVKQSSEKYEMFDNKLKVSLPTIEGFALFIGVNKTTLYEWEKDHDLFSNALDKIRIEQQKRLINSGLSGDYNSTIAKLILSSNHGMREKSDMTTNGKAIKGNTIMFTDFKDEADSQ